MTDYIAATIAWSVLDLALGIILGYGLKTFQINRRRGDK
jgi:hypothetical protein